MGVKRTVDCFKPGWWFRCKVSDTPKSKTFTFHIRAAVDFQLVIREWNNLAQEWAYMVWSPEHIAYRLPLIVKSGREEEISYAFQRIRHESPLVGQQEIEWTEGEGG
jgi:hypothetical protein